MARKPIEIWGLNEVNDVIDKLPQQYKYEFVTNTYAKIARATVLKDAKRLVPVARQKWELTNTYESRKHDPGNLRKSLGIIKYTNKKVPGVMVGPRSKMTFGKGGNKYDGWYAHMIEFGHARTDKMGNEIGYEPPQPFMRPAWDNNRDKIQSQIGKEFGKVAEQFIKKMTKRMTRTR